MQESQNTSEPITIRVKAMLNTHIKKDLINVWIFAITILQESVLRCNQPCTNHLRYSNVRMRVLEFGADVLGNLATINTAYYKSSN